MKTIRLFFVSVVLGILLSACGGGGGGAAATGTPEATPSSTPVADSPPKPVQASMYGDSTTAGLEFINGNYMSTVNSVPSDLWQILDHALGQSVTVVAAGHTGSTMRDLLDGTGGFAMPFAQAVLQDKGQVIDENFAINDWGQYSAAEFQQHLTTFVSLAQSAGKKVILEEPNPQCNPQTGQEVVSGQPIGANPLVAVIDQVGASYNVPVVHQYSLILAIPGWCQMLTDGTHPNDALYEIKAHNTADIMIPIVKSLQ